MRRTTSPPTVRRTRGVRRLWRALDGAVRRPARGDDGFFLLESVVAISLITILMGALATFTLNVTTATAELRARQGAVQVATSLTASLSAIQATDLVSGHDGTSVNTQFSNASAIVRPWIQTADMTPATGTGTVVSVPLTPGSQTLNNVAYATNIYLGYCDLRDATYLNAASTDCISPTTGTGTAQLRAVVAVSWSGRGCRSATGCTFVTSTLINTTADPIFNSNRAAPPVAPIVDTPANQIVTIGSTVSLQLAVVAGSGLAPNTWQVTSGTLPTGLTLAADGLISGTATVRQTSAPTTVTVTDAFGRTGTGTFSWTVVAAPTITTPAAQSSSRGRAVSLPVTSTCPNTPCTFTMTGAPAGLSIDAATGTISGTPTTVGTSSVTVTITDVDGVTARTNAFTWQVLPGVTIGPLGNKVTTVGTPTNVDLPYTCGAAPCTITLSGSVPGLGLSTTSGRTGSNTTTTLTVPAGNGRVFIGGTVAASAAPAGGSRTYAVTATITDSGTATASSSGTWTASTSTLVNYALGRDTSQSSTAYGGASSRAVDGNTDGVYTNGSITHSDELTNQPWWQVDLGAATTIRSVVLSNRTDCCGERLADGQVFLSNSDMTNRSFADLQADPTVTSLPFSTLSNPSLALSANDARARYVRVQLSAGSATLSLAEVQVLGPNRAAGRTTSQSSTDFGGVASRVVDSNTDGVYTNGSISHTALDSQPWWQVDLGASSTINAVTVWNRTDCCTERLDNAVLLVSPTDMTGRTYAQLNADANVTKIAFGPVAARKTVALNAITGRYVRVQLSGAAGTYLHLAEVQVNGTTP